MEVAVRNRSEYNSSDASRGGFNPGARHEQGNFRGGLFLGSRAGLPPGRGGLRRRGGLLGGHRTTTRPIATSAPAGPGTPRWSRSITTPRRSRSRSSSTSSGRSTTRPPPNRQGPDIGTQYRSAIFTHDAEQQAEALASKAAEDASGRFRRPIVTEITPATTFFRAEDYHQRYLEKHGRAGCSIH